jgi:hypothetical protein
LERQENRQNTQERLKLNYAEGAVDPEVRKASGEIDQATIDSLKYGIISGEFTFHIDPHAIPCECMDCRFQANGEAVIAPKAAGGTTSLVIMDALTSNSFRQPGNKAPAHKKKVVSWLLELNQKVGGHRAVSPTYADYAGCGAEDKLDNLDPTSDRPSILSFISRKGPKIFDDLRSLGYKAGADIEESIIKETNRLHKEGYATTGKELSAAGEDVAGRSYPIKLLDGPQKAVLAVVLTEAGQILNQKAIRVKYGNEYEVFEIAAWSIKNAAKLMAGNLKQAKDMEIAGMVYQLAAAGVIGGSGLEILVV